MESFEAKKFNSNNINGGQQLQNGDALTANMMNHIVEGLSYATEETTTNFNTLISLGLEFSQHTISASNTYSNALKGKKSGTAVRIDDVSPIWDIITVKVSGVEDVSGVKVRKYGKNLFNNDTSKISLHSFISASGEEKRYYGYEISLSAGTYTAHAEVKFGETLEDKEKYIYAYIIRVADGNRETIKALVAGNTYGKPTFTINDGDKLYFYNAWDIISSPLSVVQVTFGKLNIQIEQGESTTAFEDYIIPNEYTPDAYGTVTGVTSLSPSTTLLTDTAGAVITAEYNRDINKAFEELVNVIISLGGNI